MRIHGEAGAGPARRPKWRATLRMTLASQTATAEREAA